LLPPEIHKDSQILISGSRVGVAISGSRVGVSFRPSVYPSKLYDSTSTMTMTKPGCAFSFITTMTAELEVRHKKELKALDTDKRAALKKIKGTAGKGKKAKDLLTA
jgi:hypothetical protein